MTPTARSLAELRKRGAVPAVVERWNPHARIRQDLFGFLDIVALEPGRTGLLGVQACVTGDQSKRLAKIVQNGKAALWVACGNRIVVMGWSRRGARGKRKTWMLSETPVLPRDVTRDDVRLMAVIVRARDTSDYRQHVTLPIAGQDTTLRAALTREEET